MMTNEELKEKWETMRKGDNAFILVDSLHQVEINIGYLNSKQKTLLITNSGQIDDVPSSKAITASNFKLNDGKWALAFCLTEYDKEDIFVRFCWDIIETSRSVENDVMGFIINRYRKWIALMAHKPLDILTVSRQKGLIGELLYLQKMIEIHGGRKAVNSWSGPDWAAKDFIYDDTWAEIKAVKSSAAVVEISSVEQLDSDYDGCLVIYSLDKTTVSDITGFTLPEIVNKTETLLIDDSDSLADFRLKILEYGYSYSPKYESYKFLLDEKRIFIVTEDFPRIKRSEISPGIVNAEYTLNLAALVKFKSEDKDD